MTPTPADAATQAFEYTFPSQPQTGACSRVQTSGFFLHVDGASAQPHI